MVADRLDSATIEASVRGHFGRAARHLESVGSTNSEAMSWALEGAPEGAVVVTDHQTAGRGRWGRSWSSEPGRLLQFSVVLRPVLPTSDAGVVTTAAGVAVADGVRAASGLHTRLKWPNDVTVAGRKLSGILVESHATDSTLAIAIVGIGINVDWSVDDMPEDLRDRATSISAEKAGASRLDLLVEILAALEDDYGLARDPSGRGALIARAEELSNILGSQVTVRFVDGSSLEGVARRLLPSGALELDTQGGPREIHAGEITQLR